ncbi:MAG TPA: efflux RND transporter periplasmic adaptor subunit, partial [Elusimicrobiota bacterium]|nr:efflux RND transporter periplasmic adaptor subunit [Elusimicrobiota bacterium]
MRKKMVPLLAAALVLGAGIARWGCRRPFRYAGTLEVTEVGLSPRVAGPIREVAVREGDAVKKDQIVVRLDGDDLRLAADLADRDFRRGVTLNKNGSLPDEALDRLRFKRDDTALRLSWCDLRSPLDGVVLHRHREPGEWVAPAQNLLTLADAAHPYAYFYVAAPVMARLSVGQ